MNEKRCIENILRIESFHSVHMLFPADMSYVLLFRLNINFAHVSICDIHIHNKYSSNTMKSHQRINSQQLCRQFKAYSAFKLLHGCHYSQWLLIASFLLYIARFAFVYMVLYVVCNVCTQCLENFYYFLLPAFLRTKMSKRARFSLQSIQISPSNKNTYIDENVENIGISFQNS